jgi:hypothetical protein
MPDAQCSVVSYTVLKYVNVFSLAALFLIHFFVCFMCLVPSHTTHTRWSMLTTSLFRRELGRTERGMADDLVASRRSSELELLLPVTRRRRCNPKLKWGKMNGCSSLLPCLYICTFARLIAPFLTYLFSFTRACCIGDKEAVHSGASSIAPATPHCSTNCNSL